MLVGVAAGERPARSGARRGLGGVRFGGLGGGRVRVERMTAVAHAMFAARVRGRLASRSMIYKNAHHKAAAWPELDRWITYLEAANYAERTRYEYERTCAQVILLYPDLPFVEFTDAELLDALARWPARSRHIKKAALNGWFKWGYKKARLLPSNPADLLPDIRFQTTRNVTVFDAAEVAALRALPFPHGQLMTVLLETGLRNQEARCLTVRRVDFRTQELLVREGAKGGKERVVPLTAAASGAFHELILTDGLNPNEHFWASHPGGGHRTKRDTHLGSTSFARWWKLCLEEAGVEYRKPHTSRHSFATYWLDEGGLDDGDVQMMLGHESIRTTRDIYDHRKIGKVGDRMRRIEDARSADAEQAGSSGSVVRAGS